MLSIKQFNNSSWKICRNLPLLTARLQSTSVQIPTDEKKPKTGPTYPLLDTKFNQYQIAYRYRRNIELLRGYLVYRLFSINVLVNNQDKLAKWGRRILGNRLFGIIFKLTAFGHFVGGETPKEITPVIQRLQKYGVRPILDYSVESDDGETTSSDDHDRMHDHNTNKFIECIKTSHDVCGENNLIAIKVTALTPPNVLKKFDELLKHAKDRRAISSPIFELINRQESNDQMIAEFQQFNKLSTENKQNQQPTVLTNDELIAIRQLLIRLNKIAQACVENKISIMVDAEQSYFQTAINYLATELQRYYNKHDTPIIHGTYQCYLKETLTSLKHDLALAEREDYIFAAKLVRGAYIEQERRRAKELGCEDPVNPSFEATSQMYHACLDEVMNSAMKREKGRVIVMVASHNEDTIRYAIQKMKDLDIRRASKFISFASLYGMSDYVGFALANSGYRTYKYLPYGPIEALQPYLFRRAQENRSIFEKAHKDRRLHFKALKDRIMNSKN